ncbi:outer membrane protein assembly factor BamB family protein [Halosimplex sp. J119]
MGGAVLYLIGGRSGSDAESEPATDRAPTPLSTTGNWRQYRADAANTLSKPDTTVLPESGTVYWQSPASSAPVFDDDAMFLERPNGSASVTIAAHSRETGDSLWAGPNRTGTARSPAVGRYVFGTGSAVTGIDVEDGDVEWQVEPKAHGPWAPVLNDRTLYLIGERYDETPAMLLAMDDETGQTRWKDAFRGPETDIESGPAVGEEHVYVATKAGRVIAYAKSDGRRRWVANAMDAVRVPVTIGDGSVFVADESGTISAFATADGTLRWRRSVAEPSDGFAYGAGTLYYAAEGGVYAMDASDGSERWVFTGSDPLAPAVGAEAVYVATGLDDRGLYAVEKATGNPIWSYTFPRVYEGDLVQGGARFPPVALDGGLFVTADDGLYAFGPAD